MSHSPNENNIPIKNENVSSEISLEEINQGFTKSGECIKRVFQIFFAGDFGVGKTCLFRRYIDGTYNETMRCTINPDYYTKDYELDNDRAVTLKFVDISGYELYSDKTHSLYKGSVGAIVIFDVTRIDSFNKIEEWKKDIDEKVQVSGNRPIPCLLIGNKIDCCQDHKIFKSKEEIEKFVVEKKFIKYFETSAKEQINIDEPLNYLINYIIDNKIEPFVDDGTNTSTESDSSNCFLS